MGISLRSRLASVLIGLSLMLASPALASPGMFSGFVDVLSAYHDICAPGYFFQGGDSAYPCTQAVTTNASVMTGTGGFTLPASIFTNSTIFTAAFPGYPFFAASYTFSNQTGSFKASYFKAGLMTTIPVNKTGFPTLPSVPRSGSFKITYGPKGFGGAMPLGFGGTVTGTVAGGFGSYDFDLTIFPSRGFAAPSWNSTAGMGTLSHQTAFSDTTKGGTTPLMGATFWLSQRMPFFTGTVMGYAPQGIEVTTVTDTVGDARTTTYYMSGMISLVSPSMVFSYRAFPDASGAITALVWGSVSLDRIKLSFLPEPGRLALLGAGVLGLFAMYRARRS